MIGKIIKFFQFLLITTPLQTVLFFGVSWLFYDGAFLNDEAYFLAERGSGFSTEIESYFVYFFFVSFLASNIFCYLFAVFVSGERLKEMFILWFFSLIFILLISYFGLEFALVFLLGLFAGILIINKPLQNLVRIKKRHVSK